MAEAATSLSAVWRPARPACLHPSRHRNGRSAGGVGQRVIRPQRSSGWVGSWAGRGPKEAPQGLSAGRGALWPPLPLPALFPGRVPSTGCWSEFWALPTLFRCSRFPGGSGVKNPPANAGDTWVRKTPCRRAWQPTPVFLHGKLNGQRSLVVSRPCGQKSRTQLSTRYSLPTHPAADEVGGRDGGWSKQGSVSFCLTDGALG